VKILGRFVDRPPALHHRVCGKGKSRAPGGAACRSRVLNAAAGGDDWSARIVPKLRNKDRVFSHSGNGHLKSDFFFWGGADAECAHARRRAPASKPRERRPRDDMQGCLTRRKCAESWLRHRVRDRLCLINWVDGRVLLPKCFVAEVGRVSLMSSESDGGTVKLMCFDSAWLLRDIASKFGVAGCRSPKLSERTSLPIQCNWAWSKMPLSSRR